MVKGFHIELTNICTLKCAGCARTQFIDRFPQHWKNHSVNIDDLFNFLDCDLKDKHIGLCGHYGDPIYHPDFHNIIAVFKEKGAVIKLTTNGSYKTESWWEKTVNILDQKDTVTFSVDGLPENFTNYRVNADWKSIEIGMKVVAESQCKSQWSFIPFNYNENNIDEARELCKKIGIKEFVVNKSDRWDKYTDHLKPSNNKIGQRYDSQQQWKNTATISGIDPECNRGQAHFITADGCYTPCCFSADFRFYYKTPFGKNKQKYSIKNNTLSSVLADNTTVDFYNSLENHKVCQFNCPKLENN